MERWRLKIALRNFIEIVAVLAFVVLIAPLIERFMVNPGLGVAGASRIVAPRLIFIAWALLAGLLLKLNRERLSDIGLKKPLSVDRTTVYGILVAAAVFSRPGKHFRASLCQRVHPPAAPWHDPAFFEG